MTENTEQAMLGKGSGVVTFPQGGNYARTHV